MWNILTNCSGSPRSLSGSRDPPEMEMKESREERLPLIGEPSLSRSAPSTFISGHFWKGLRFNYDILWPAKISLSAGSLNAASMQVFSDCPHLLHCTFTFIPGVPPISFTVRLVAIKRSTLFHLENARFLWLLVLRLVFHDAKTPAAAKSAAQFSSTGDESNG